MELEQRILQSLKVARTPSEIEDNEPWGLGIHTKAYNEDLWVGLTKNMVGSPLEGENCGLELLKSVNGFNDFPKINQVVLKYFGKDRNFAGRSDFYAIEFDIETDALGTIEIYTFPVSESAMLDTISLVVKHRAGWYDINCDAVYFY